MVYSPAEDSIFFADFLKKYFSKLSKKQKQNISYLDMGTGSGILAEIAIKSGISKENIIAVDTDKEAVEFVKTKNLGIKVIHSNFFSKLKSKEKPHFDIITFNAPYLPDNKYDNQKDTSGGKFGDESSIKFIKQAKAHLTKQGKIFLLISSLTPMNKINKFNPKIVAKTHLFFEDLLILEIKQIL